MSDRSIFPDVHAQAPTDALINVYEQAAPRVEQDLTGITADELWTRARGPDRWSVGEIVCHLADSEIIAAARLRVLRHRPGTKLIVYDPDVFADALDYQRRDALDVDIALERPEGNLCEGVATVNGKELVRARFLILFVPKDKEPPPDPAVEERRARHIQALGLSEAS